MAFSKKHQDTISSGGTPIRTNWEEVEKPKHLSQVIFHTYGVCFVGMYSADLDLFTGTGLQIDQQTKNPVPYLRTIPSKDVDAWFYTPTYKKQL